MKWAQNIIFGMLLALVLTISGLMVYDLTATQNFTILVNIDKNADPFEAIPKIVSNSDKILSVRKTDNAENTYEVKIITRRTKKGLLDWLLKNRDVEDASIEEF